MWMLLPDVWLMLHALGCGHAVCIHIGSISHPLRLSRPGTWQGGTPCAISSPNLWACVGLAVGSWRRWMMLLSGRWLCHLRTTSQLISGQQGCHWCSRGTGKVLALSLVVLLRQRSPHTISLHPVRKSVSCQTWSLESRAASSCQYRSNWVSAGVACVPPCRMPLQSPWWGHLFGLHWTCFLWSHPGTAAAGSCRISCLEIRVVGRTAGRGVYRGAWYVRRGCVPSA